MKSAAYDLFPFVPVASDTSAVASGWEAIAARLLEAVARRDTPRTTLVVECYPGVDEAAVLRELAARLHPARALAAADALRPPCEIDALVSPFLGDDPVFGRMNTLELPQFFSPGRMAAARDAVAAVRQGLLLIVGCGAQLIERGDVLVYADLSRREAQLRQRRNEAGNLGAANCEAPAALKYKRAFFVDWRVCDRAKAASLGSWDFVLDTHRSALPQLVMGALVRRGWREAVRRPFRVVPYFDPAPWGGHWLREHLGLDDDTPNYGWGFDCVPEENSLLLGFGAARIELPAMNLVLAEPRALLGEEIHRRFGAEFPIRFDFLDTMGGGNLSLQVHPTADYIRRTFGMSYTQDESYYILAAAPDATVWLGLQENIAPAEMVSALRAAQAGSGPFAVERFASRWPARRHDHFSIPAGTVHCSGRNALVLEISATPYLFTFKLWDWNRAGLDGQPRPIHLDHGAANIAWDRTTTWTREHLIGQATVLARGTGWIEERTGLHASQFIETRRHWFAAPVHHDTAGRLNVLNLVAGEAAVVESPESAFAPFPIHFAETFIVPAGVGRYTITPLRAGADARCATIKAYVRPDVA